MLYWRQDLGRDHVSETGRGGLGRIARATAAKHVLGRCRIGASGSRKSTETRLTVFRWVLCRIGHLFDDAVRVEIFAWVEERLSGYHVTVPMFRKDWPTMSGLMELESGDTSWSPGSKRQGGLLLALLPT